MDFTYMYEKASQDFKKFLNDRYNRLFFILSVFLIMGWASYTLYNYHFNSVQAKAQRSFSEAMQTYNEALNSTNGVESSWAQVELAFRLGYEQNKGTTLAPFFLVYRSQALLKLDKKEEAYQELEKAVSLIPKKSPFHYFYDTKRVLMEFDMDKESAALNDLISLGKDRNNPFSDTANYYLGEYYWSKNMLAEAKEFYQKIVAVDSNVDSPWKNMAQEKLQGLE